MRLVTRRRVVLFALLIQATAASGSSIDWEVVDRFRLFGDADVRTRERVHSELEALQQITTEPILQRYHQLLALLSGPAAQSLRRSNWDSENRSYAGTYLYPAAYRVSVKVPSAPAGAACLWNVRTGESSATSTRGACDGTILDVAAEQARDGAREGRASVSVEVLATGTRHAAELVVRDLLVVAIGDSFISGEGNPDVPADFGDLPAHRSLRGRSWIDDIHDLPVAKAQWWDEPCHRSLLSWPVLAAFYQAARHPRDAVTLVHLGCSGAEIFDGVLDAQERGLPGCPEETEIPRNCPPASRERRSQLDALQDLIGRGGRRIDRLFLSVGGNDVGFARIIPYLLAPQWANALAPELLGTVCPLTFVTGSSPSDRRRAESGPMWWMCRRMPSAQERLGALPQAYRRLAEALGQMGVDPARVFHTAYPNLLEDEPAGDSTRYCRHAARQPAHGFEALEAMLPRPARDRGLLSFRFQHDDRRSCSWPAVSRDNSEVCKADWVWRELNRTIATSVAGGSRYPPFEVAEVDRRRIEWMIRGPTEPPFKGPYGWTVVTRHVAESRGHGWCRQTELDPLELPQVQGWDWRNGYLPRNYIPYLLERQRWFRTTNDSVLTQYGGAGRFHHGTVHPTYRAHVAIAQAVADAAFPPER